MHPVFHSTRSAAVSVAASVLLTVSGVSAETKAPAKPDRPNFLFVYLDDQRWDAMQFFQKLQGDKGRFPWLKTPNIDKLASQSVCFRNAFATDSLCSPSRASFLTGQYPHVHGVTNNHQPFPPKSITYATLLHDAGYYTGFIGKWHMGEQRERPGFDYSASFLGQGSYYKCPFVINGNETVVSDKWVDDTSTDYALDFLKQHKDQPFMLAVGFKSTHGPFQPNMEDKDIYKDESPRPVPNLTSVPTWREPFDSRPYPAKVKKLLPYMECLTGADRDIGRLMDGLDQLGLSRNTLVIYASDNGYDVGEHELGDKRAAYEESMRIPFLVRVPFIPGSAGRAEDHMVLNVDVAPTLLDFAGVAIPKTMQGRSIRPLLEKKEVADWSNRSFLYEYFFEKTYLWPTMVGIRTDDAKLVTYNNHPEWTELFKLDNDPYEIKNLAGQADAKDLQGRMNSELTHLKEQLAYVIPGDSDKDTYVADAKEDFDFRRMKSDYPAPTGRIRGITPSGAQPTKTTPDNPVPTASGPPASAAEVKTGGD